MQRLILAAVLSLASLTAHADEQLRKVTPFKGIVVQGPVSLVVEAGKSYSLRVEGDPTFIGRVTSEVVGGELRLGMKESKRTNIGNGDRVVVTEGRDKGKIATIGKISKDSMTVELEGNVSVVSRPC